MTTPGTPSGRRSRGGRSAGNSSPPASPSGQDASDDEILREAPPHSGPGGGVEPGSILNAPDLNDDVIWWYPPPLEQDVAESPPADPPVPPTRAKRRRPSAKKTIEPQEDEPTPPPEVELWAAAPLKESVTPSPHPARASVLVAVGPSDIDGLPAAYDDGTAWLRSGFRRHRAGSWAALLAGWTGVWIALWGAAVGILAGVLAASGLAGRAGSLGVGQAASGIGIVGGGAVGALGGFLVVIRYLIVDRPWQTVVSVASGAVIAAGLVLVTAAFERFFLRLRGYRRLSRDEVRRVAPLVKHVADAMNLPALPRFAMSDVLVPNAWTHMRTIVLTAGLLQTLTDEELTAVLAHELEHWQRGDSVGLHFVWASALPVALVYNIGMSLAGHRGKGNGTPPPSGVTRSVMTIVGYAIAWPTVILLKLVITPIVAASQRRYEYEADQGAARIGLAVDLSLALRKMSAFEGGRTGWEQAIAGTYPPLELRLEALQPPRPDDYEYQEEELRGPSWPELRRLAMSWRPKAT